MQYKVVQTNAGYAVQNVKTFSIVNVYNTSKQAEKVAQQLNKKA